MTEEDRSKPIFIEFDGRRYLYAGKMRDWLLCKIEDADLNQTKVLKRIYDEERKNG